MNRSVYLIPVLLDRLDVAVGRTAERDCGWRLVDDDGERSVRRAGAARRMLGERRLFRDLRLGLAAVDSGGGGGVSWWLVVAVVVALRGIRRDPLRHQRREPMGMVCCSLASLH